MSKTQPNAVSQNHSATDCSMLSLAQALHDFAADEDPYEFMDTYGTETIRDTAENLLDENYRQGVISHLREAAWYQGDDQEFCALAKRSSQILALMHSIFPQA